MMLDTTPLKNVISSYLNFGASLQQELEDDYTIFQDTTDFEMQSSNHQFFQENKFKLSFFDCKKDNQPNPGEQTWDEFISNFDKPHVRASKDGELFSPATFNGKRANENVQELSMIALDFDRNADWENDLSVFRNLNITFAAHTSHSHLRVVPPTKKSKGNPNAEPRFRVIVPLLTSIPRNKYKSLWKFFDNLIDGKIDGAPKALAKAFQEDIQAPLVSFLFADTKVKKLILYFALYGSDAETRIFTPVGKGYIIEYPEEP